MSNNIVSDIKSALNAKSVGLNFGFLGLGMGGCSIAAECANIKLKDGKTPYKAILINTNTQDFNKLRIENKTNIHKIELKGFEEGAGRNIKVGHDAFKKNNDLVLDVISKNFTDRDFIWVVVGLGGGTGTGSVDAAIELLYTNGFQGKFGLILTLPMDDEGGQVFKNALAQFKWIANNSKGMGSIIVVDNQKIYDEYSSKKDAAASDFLNYCNQYVADILHEMNVVTQNYAPLGRDHFDVSEFKRLIKEPGFLTLVRTDFDNPSELPNNTATITKVGEAIESGVLSNGYNFKNTKRAAIAVLANESNANRHFNVSFNDTMIDVMNKYAKNAAEKPIATYADNGIGGKAKIYAAFAGLNLPTRISRLIEEYEEYNLTVKELEKEEDEVLTSLELFSIDFDDNEDEVETPSINFGNPSSDNKTERETKEEFKIDFHRR